jgi:CheY-like chemotaxis protein
MTRILLIEDDPLILENVDDILTLEGFQTVTAQDGEEGLSLAQREDPDLIVCDVMLPGLTGYEILYALRQNEKTENIPFIFLTGQSDKADIRHGMELGADDYLTKPFTPSELKRAVASRLAKHLKLEQQTQRKLGTLRHNIANSLPHELNTPLVGVINGAQVLRQCYGSLEQAEIMEMLDGIEQAGKRLYSLVQNFLIYADLEVIGSNSDEVTALREGIEYCFPAQIMSTIAMQKAQRMNREADLEIEVSALLENDGCVNMLESRFIKAMEEIIDNAFKFSSPGTPVKVIGYLEGLQVHLQIADQGRGMTPEQIAEVGAYTQFQRKLYEQQGFGLGLIIAKRMFELYGGQFMIDSHLEQGTTIHITLPVLAVD